MRRTKRLLTILLILCMSIGMTMMVSAKPKKITAKSTEFTTSAKQASKTATTVKRGGYTIVMPQKNYACLKFKAPATKKYTFYVTNVIPSGSYTCGFFEVCTRPKVTSYNGDTILTIPGKKNKPSTSYFASDNSVKGYKTKVSKSHKLRKGQTVYVFIYGHAKQLSFQIK